MDEPPIPHPSEDDNPFAPGSFVDEPNRIANRGIYLPASYWVTLFLALVFFAALSYFFYGIGIPAVVATIAASIRVPIMQNRLAQLPVPRRPMSPVLMLLISWSFMLLACFAALFAFVIICVPISIFSYSGSSGGGDSAIFAIFGASGLVAFGCFVFLFYLSTKLPV
ncbi:MAG: hypothetical protein Aurels2KO_14630 [Aureliella sp.]